MPPKSKTEIATIDRTRPVGEQLAAVIRGEGAIAADDPKIIAEQIALQTLAKDSLEDVFAVNTGSVNSTDLVDHRLEVRGFVLRHSELENTNAYMLIDAYDIDEKKDIVWNTSATKVLAQLAAAHDILAKRGTPLDAQAPLKVQVVEIGQASAGQSAPVGLILVT